MARFICIHHAPGLGQEEFLANAPRVVEAKYAKMERCFVNLASGLIVQICEADSAEAVEKEFERLGFPFDEIHELQLEATYELLAQLVHGK
jgi:hypothetical protein